MDVCISRRLKEQRAWAIGKWLQVISNIMLFKGRGTWKNLIMYIFSLGGIKTHDTILKFLEFIKVVKQADKICQNSHSNCFFRFAYYITGLNTQSNAIVLTVKASL